MGKKGILFIDDMNLPAPDAYGFQPPLELLRQYLEFGGWYAIHELKMIHVVDFTLVSSMGPPGGSRNVVPQRLLRHFFCFSSIENSDKTLLRIFGKIGKWISAKKDLSEDAQRLVGFAVDASVEMYQILQENLKATPQKPHYLFNLRDVSKLFQGIHLVHPKEFKAGQNKVARIWIHELYRVIADRLLYQADKEVVFERMKYVLNLKLRANFETIMNEILPKGEKLNENYTDVERIVMTDVTGEAINVEERDYIEHPDLGAVRKKVELYLEEFNMTSKTPMNIIIFDFATIQILKICRILKLDKSHGVLIGLGGSGRQTLAKLSSFIMNQNMINLEVHSKYSEKDWRADIKKILSQASLNKKASMLFITEVQSRNEYLMQDVDSMLNLGEIPNLFEHDEFIAYLEKLKERAKREGEDKLLASGSFAE